MIELADAKAHLRIEPDEDAEDGYIEGLVAAALRHAEQIIQSNLEPAECVLRLDSFPPQSRALLLPWEPVMQVTSVSYLDIAGIERTLAQTAYVLDAYGRTPILRRRGLDYWPLTNGDPQNVTIKALVGYETLPADIRVAILLIVGHLYENREQVSATATFSELPLGVRDFLNPYMNRPVG